MANAIAEKTGVGPKVYYYLADTGVEIFEWLDGYYPLSFGEIINEDLMTKIITMISRYYNSGKVLPFKSTMFEQAWDMINRASAGNYVSPWKDRMQILLHQIEEAMNFDGIEFKPCHNDFWVNNMICNREAKDLKIIDFEYASMSDP